MRDVMRPWLVGVLLLVCVGAVVAQGDAGPSPVTTRHVAGKVHEIQLIDGTINMLASVGEDGTLLVDTGYAQTAPGALAAISALGGGPAQVIVNTHADGDHVGGNAILGPSALVIAHDEARRRAGSYFALPQAQGLGSAVLTIRAPTTLHFNGEDILLLPMPGGHTAADLVVHFTGSGVVAAGDIVLTGTFPDADPGRGGDSQRLVAILQELVRALPAETLVVPGHGETLRAGELHGYLAMIEGSIAAVRGELAAGRTFAEMLAGDALATWATWEHADQGLSCADWGGQIWASLNGVERRSICAPVTEALVSEGVEAAVATYRRLAAAEPERWDLSENQLNTLGYQLLQRNLVDEAITIFELNVEIFPEASNPYDSLGEAYMTAGDRERAIVNYRRSLELDPGNTNAVAKIEELRALK